jgi:hypothetical protein
VWKLDRKKRRKLRILSLFLTVALNTGGAFQLERRQWLRTRLGRGERGNAPGKGGNSNHLVFPSVNAKRQVSAQSSERRVKIKVGAMGVRLIGGTVVTVLSSRKEALGMGGRSQHCYLEDFSQWTADSGERTRKPNCRRLAQRTGRCHRNYLGTEGI